MDLEMKVSSRKQAINVAPLNKMSLQFRELEIMQPCLPATRSVVVTQWRPASATALGRLGIP